VALAVSEKLAASIEKTGSQTHEAIKEGSYVTQTELRRLQIAQDLSMVQMRLSNVQSEIRSIERMPMSSLTRNQLRELRTQEVDLKRQIQTLSDVLNPPQLTATSSGSPSKQIASENKVGNAVLQLFFSKNGRISRTQYWIGMIVVSITLFIAAGFNAGAIDPETGEAVGSAGLCGGILLILGLWMFYAVSAKRYHDRGKTSLWVLIALIPIVQFWQLIELGFLPSVPGPHKYS
jgi:uncharacterized membrane protein YhaH (DUF805 family)